MNQTQQNAQIKNISFDEKTKNKKRVSVQRAVGLGQRPMTEAFRKIDVYRDLINHGMEKIQASDFSYTIYLSTDKGNLPIAKGYLGRSKATYFTYRFVSEEARASHLKKIIEKFESEKHIKKAVPQRELNIGDVLVSSWGYDQTNIDFYLVTRLVGKNSVEIVEIACVKKYHDSDYGTCLPDISKIIGEPLIKVARGKRVKISSYSSASKHDGTPMGWSSYH